MRTDNNTERWKEHRESTSCKTSKKGAGQTFLTSFVMSRKNPGSSLVVPRKLQVMTGSVECPGCGFAQDERIPQMLRRTVVSCGGGPRRDVLRRQVEDDMKQNDFKLTAKQIELRVLTAERAQAQWINHHSTVTVSSPNCEKFGQVSPTGAVLPCVACQNVLKLKLFRNALRKNAPEKGMAKYTPNVYRNDIIAEAALRHKDVQELLEMVSANVYWTDNDLRGDI